MKIATIAEHGEERLGLVDETLSRITPLRNLTGGGKGLLALLEFGESIKVDDKAPALAIAPGVLKAPVPHPARNIFCVGKNYAAHAAEIAKAGTGPATPSFPIFFTKVPESVIGPGEPILIDPAVSTAIDYEGELAVIVGKAGRNIKAEEAMAHVWGYTIINDVTARDLQKRHSQWLIGKSQDTFCPMGPWAVTADEVDLANTGLRTFVNGELRQDGNTRDFIFNVPMMIAAISNGITLNVGDIIATGTPSGVGLGFDPPRFLKPGDVVRIEIDGIGALENPVEERKSA
jgi:2-keto-4-pentenoate hydratase/2-oxohepta-3-ene-1,7-dioic acid hydratase in catechol pathway